MDTARWAQELIKAFPKLFREDFRIVEPASDRYNCIAYIAGDTAKTWWPNEIDYWPPKATRDNRVGSLEEALADLGYEQCDDSNVEAGYQKIALYGFQGRIEHAAVQMPSGRWRSKMGRGPVIEHFGPESLSGGPYGDTAAFMRRPSGPTD